MNCTDANPMLDLLLDGILEPKDTLSVIEHMRSCPACEKNWHDLEELRGNFNEARALKPDTTKLKQQIFAQIKKEESWRSLYTGKAGLRLVAAAALLCLSLTLMNGLRSVKLPERLLISETQPALVKELIASPQFENIADRSELPQKLGYDLVFVHPPKWHIYNTGLLKQNGKAAIARFDFTRQEGGREEHLTCYQAQAGTLFTGALSTVDIAGKQVHFGTFKDKHYALWSQNSRDYLFVTALPAAKLIEIVSKS